MINKDKKLKPLVILVGPTASGKTDVALALAKRIKAEIISADSRQIYKKMDIGTAKPLGEWRNTEYGRRLLVNNVVHHMIDVVSPEDEFNAGIYKKHVDRIIQQIYRRKKIPIIVGGTGLYIKAVIDGLCPSPPVDKNLRRRLKTLAEKYPSVYLYKRLKKVDPESASKIHPNNLVRIIRALEVYETSGVPLSEYQKKTAKPKYDIRMFGLLWDRETLYERIENRVDDMFRRGLVNEVKGLLKQGYTEKLNSMQGLGYKQIIGYLKARYSLEEAKRLLKRDTRRYAKRQLTWFRKDKRVRWIKIDKKLNVEKIIEEVQKLLKKKKPF